MVANAIPLCVMHLFEVSVAIAFSEFSIWWCIKWVCVLPR